MLDTLTYMGFPSSNSTSTNSSTSSANFSSKSAQKSKSITQASIFDYITSPYPTQSTANKKYSSQKKETSFQKNQNLKSNFHNQYHSILKTSQFQVVEKNKSSSRRQQSGCFSQRFPELSFSAGEKLWFILRQRERKHVKSSRMLQNHEEITAEMREQLIDWLMEISQLYSLHQETLFLSIDLIDRYTTFSFHSILSDQYQLLGITALFVASKLEEIYPPKLTDFAYITDDLYSIDQIKQQEALLLQILEFDLISAVTPLTWLRIYCQKLVLEPELFASKDENLSLVQQNEHFAAFASLNSLSTNIYPPCATQKYSNTDSSYLSIDTLSSSFFTTGAESSSPDSTYLTPKFQQSIYDEAVALLNIVILDLKSSEFLPSILAACALAYSAQHFNLDSKTGKFTLNYEPAIVSNKIPSNALDFAADLLGPIFEPEKVSKALKFMLSFAKCRAELLNYKKPWLLSQNFENLAQEKNPSSNKFTQGPKIVSFIQKHENQLDLLKRARVWQERELVQQRKCQKMVQ